MEARLLQGFEMDAFDSPLRYLAMFGARRPLPDTPTSIAVELLIMCTREYPLLRLQPSLLAACCLYIAVRNTPSREEGSTQWDDVFTACCGYTPQTLCSTIEAELLFLRDAELSCRSIASASRVKTIKINLFTLA